MFIFQETEQCDTALFYLIFKIYEKTGLPGKDSSCHRDNDFSVGT